MPEPRGPEGATCPTCRGTGADPMSDVTNWFPCQRCNGSGKVDPAPSSPSPAGQGEAAELVATLERQAGAVRDRLPGLGLVQAAQVVAIAVALEGAAAQITALLDRLRESRDAHEQSVLAALVQAGALRAEVARLTAHLATARREEREAWWDLVDRAANALNDSICASGNRVSTNMHWVNKLRRDGEALRTREAAP